MLGGILGIKFSLVNLGNGSSFDFFSAYVTKAQALLYEAVLGGL